MKSPTYEQIANNWGLWQWYVDPDGLGEKSAFYAMSIEERLEFIEECFGKEQVEA